MKSKTNTVTKNILIVALILSLSLSTSMLYRPKTSQAIGGVPIDTMLNFHSIQDYLKTFTLDKLAVMIANQLLQKMTASIVNWINTGFQGSPAFITNPEGFFLDVGDQITGEFLSGSGELSKLCSPFSFDIRLNLALNQSTYATKRYTCTLGRIVNNTRNAIATAGQNSGVTITGDPNGATLGDFMSGDFNQGGYAGFLSYSMEPQNNPIGATLMARADLQTRIDEKKAAINTDLNRGQGFLSWQKCTDVTSSVMNSEYELGDLDTGGQLRQFGNQTIITGSTDLNKPTSIQKKVDPKTGIVAYQDCQTSTPGSVIGGTLQRQLNVPADKLVLVKTISDSIDAMLGALVNQMFTQGLAALSGRGSSIGGRNQSYLVQLSEEADSFNNAEAQRLRDTSSDTTNAIVNTAQNNANLYGQALDLLNISRANYQSVKQCFVAKVASRPLLTQTQKDFAQSQINTIDTVISGNIDPLIATTTVKKLTAQSQADLFVSLLNAASGSSSPNPGFNSNDFAIRQARLDAVVRAGSVATQSGVADSSAAQQTLSSTQALTTSLNRDVELYRTACNQFPDQINNRLGR